jgi:hypothetical protein
MNGPLKSDPQFLTVSDLAKKYSAFTAGGLRWLLFNREQNGFNRCVVRIGRRVLIDEAEFVTWLRDQLEARAA